MFRSCFGFLQVYSQVNKSSSFSNLTLIFEDYKFSLASSLGLLVISLNMGLFGASLSYSRLDQTFEHKASEDVLVGVSQIRNMLEISDSDLEQEACTENQNPSRLACRHNVWLMILGQFVILMVCAMLLWGTYCNAYPAANDHDLIVAMNSYCTHPGSSAT